jgi:membrane protease YdiL (CAAX protease family)
MTVLINKKQTITSIFIVLCLFGYIFFPANEFFQYKAVAIIFLVVLPILYTKYFLKSELHFNQFTLGDWKKNIVYLICGLLVAFIVIGSIFIFTDFKLHYFLSAKVKNDFISFLYYELTGVLFTVAVYEGFFRGFIMSYFLEKYKKWSIMIQFLFLLVMIAIFHLPYWFYIMYVIFAPIGGWIYYKSNSLVYSFFGQLLFIILFDATFIALTVNK